MHALRSWLDSKLAITKAHQSPAGNTHNWQQRLLYAYAYDMYTANHALQLHQVSSASTHPASSNRPHGLTSLKQQATWLGTDSATNIITHSLPLTVCRSNLLGMTNQ
jgi:hypothetical protein